jgi:hypothetical protein
MEINNCPRNYPTFSPKEPALAQYFFSSLTGPVGTKVGCQTRFHRCKETAEKVSSEYWSLWGKRAIMVSAVVDFHSTWLLAAEVAPMLDYSLIPPLSKWELEIFGIVVPEDHYLRNVASVIPWDDFRDLLAPYYCQDMGRPPLLPVVMLKLEYLRYHHNLSDRQVIARAETDLAFRWFLQYPLQCPG